MRHHFDPLTPERPHAPADGTGGVVVGNDTNRPPRVRPRGAWDRWRWLLPFLLAALVGLLVMVAAIVFAPQVVGTTGADKPPAPITTPPYRTDDRVCRCGTR